MAAALHMQPPPPRPSMDRSHSHEQQTRARSTPPFPSPYEHNPSPSFRSQSRASSNTSSTSPYQQPFANSYFPPTHSVYSVPPQAWSTTALPASAFQPSPFSQLYPNQPIFHPGFQQSQADFAAWANAYQHMAMASAAGGGMASPPAEYHGGEYGRTSSGPPVQYRAQGHDDFGAPQQIPPPQQGHHNQTFKQPQPFHPYKRDPSHRVSRDPMPRSSSSPSLSSTLDQLSPSSSMSSSRGPPTLSDHQRSSSVESSVSSVVPPPRVGSRAEGREDPFSSERRRDEQQSPRTSSSSAPSTPAKSISPVPTIKAVTPLHSGPIANATNTIPSAGPRPSPLTHTPIAPSPGPTEKMTKSGGLKGRLRKALDSPKKTSTPPSPAKATPTTPSRSVFTSPSETSTRSASPPPATPPQPMPMPSPTFANMAAMSSEVSLATTERTATATGEGTKKEAKRSLFRMKNMSTDNISLSSTVSSASMMIRKMGSIGKLARRNSLMGISKIFKDKPKDEDASLPEKEANKKDKKDKKSKKGKAEAAPATVSRATVESEHLTADDDRALAGLSPAAKLARQHTLRSRAEAAKNEVQAGGTGEPTWDNNTKTRQNQVLPSIGSVTEVLHVRPRQGPTVVHAVAVSEHEYDSEDDSSDGETVEDVTISMGRVSLSEDADADFQATWGNAYIDRHAVPKKGILKSVQSYSEVPDANANTLPTKSTAFIDPPTRTTQIDSLHHLSPKSSRGDAYDPFSPSFSPFDQPPDDAHRSPYQNPTLNTSAPTLTLVTPTKPITPRSMTVPARRRIIWAPECAVYSTYDAGTYDRRSEPATCNRLTPELAMSIKQELNAFKLEMPVHPASRVHTQYFA